MGLLFRLTAFCWIILIGMSVSAQQWGNYNPEEAFAADFYPSYGDEYRTADGRPGPKYWQNRADYNINASLDEIKNSVSGSVEITYTNNSPSDLEFLWLQLDQNIYDLQSRGVATTTIDGGRWANRNEFDGGYELKSVTFKNGKAASYFVTDTRMKVNLEQPLKANGGKITFKIDYSFLIPEYGTDRMGRLQTKNGWIYEVAQWFPRLCVYDNISGWNVLPYIGQGEFYLEYGDVVYNIEAPASHIVVGSGELLNPQEVLTAKQLERWKTASQSEKTVMLRTAKEIKDPSSRPTKTKRLTWKFKCENTRDVAWASSPAFVWDAARINLPGGKTSLAMSVYPEEVGSDQAWGRSTEYTKGCVEFYSNYLYPYPYPTAINVAGIVRGMEYPGIVFCGINATGAGLWGVTSHEFGHIWFPMIVGSNERKHAWMDEGFNTFINTLAENSFNNGEYANNRELSASRLTQAFFGKNAQSIYNAPDVVQQKNLGIVAYYKPGFGINLLRENILGKERFDSAFRYYAQQWAYKHPTPWDFFHCIENHAGESLDWFWRGWFLNNWKIDVAVKDVEYSKNDPANGSVITIANLEQLPMPVVVQIKERNGKTGRINLPVEIWQRGGIWKFNYKSTDEITEVSIDPDETLPDINRDNNKWSAK